LAPRPGARRRVAVAGTRRPAAVWVLRRSGKATAASAPLSGRRQSWRLAVRWAALWRPSGSAVYRGRSDQSKRVCGGEELGGTVQH